MNNPELQKRQDAEMTGFLVLALSFLSPIVVFMVIDICRMVF